MAALQVELYVQGRIGAGNVCRDQKLQGLQAIGVTESGLRVITQLAGDQKIIPGLVGMVRAFISAVGRDFTHCIE